MLSDLIKREEAMGNKDGSKRQSHKDKAEAFREELGTIRESMRADGIKDPLKVCQNSKGKWLILDGRHRHEQAIELGMETVPCREYPESEAREIIMAAAVRRQVSKGARAYQAVTFFPEVAMDGKQRKLGNLSRTAVTAVREDAGPAVTAGPQRPPSETTETLATRTGVSLRLMEYAIWLYKKFQEREDLRLEFEPSIFAGNSLDKIKGAVEARLQGKTDAGDEDEQIPSPQHEKLVKFQTYLYSLGKSWETWDALGDLQKNATVLLCSNLKKAPAHVREELVKALTEAGEVEP
jgi:hypothetical protein